MEEARIPWLERATAVGRGGDDTDPDRRLLFEGTLLEVATALSRWKAGDLTGVRVSLPDRGVPPRRFDGPALLEVIARAKAARQRA